MLKILLFSQSQTVRSCLAVAVKAAIKDKKEDSVAPACDIKPIGISAWAEGSERKRLAEFDRLCGLIGAEMKDDPVHGRFIGVLDLPGVSRAEDIRAFTSIQGMLILAFPEIQWIPLYEDAVLWPNDRKDRSVGTKNEDDVMTLVRAAVLCQGGYSPLFDGDGLRSVLLERAHTGKCDPAHLNYSRTDVAFAIDEEASFAAMNAYTAYRFGYRAFPVTSRAAMDDLLKTRPIPHARGMNAPREESRSVAFEDIYLEFPDAIKAYNDTEIAFGEKRAKNFPRLTTVDLCVFTTAADNDEKVFERRKTIAEYFRNISRHRPLSSRRSWFKLQIEHAKRYFFNLSGGFWPGYWAISLSETLLAATLLFVTFFKWPGWFLPLLLLIFIVRGMLRRQIHNLIHDKLRTASWLGALLRRREQWPFMPKCYENHCPVVLGSGTKYWETAHKPVAGIFGLRNKTRLPDGRNYGQLFRSGDIRAQYRAALRSAPRPAAPGGTNHASPGVALELATRLLRRAERMKSSVIDAEGAVHAAVLANVAVELLNYKTPSVSIEAFKWKHYYEVLAECEFVGVRANLDMKERYIDIHNGMERICRSEATGKVREIVFLSAMSELVDQLAKLLGDKGKVEEAAYFRTHSRRLHRKLMSPFGRALLAYPEWVLRGKWHFIASFGLFFAAFLIYCRYWIQPNKSWIDSVVLAYQVMVSRLNYTAPNSQNQFVVLLARQVGILHLGFVATHFLMFMNRK